jgi:aminoglycoside 3'-phosphotransferase-2
MGNVSSTQFDPPEVRWAAEVLQSSITEWSVVYARNGRSTKRLRTGAQVVYLKIDRDLSPERDRLRWLGSVQPAPQVLGFRPGSPDWLLTSAASGLDLTAALYIERPALVVRLLAEALTNLHRINPKSCPFGRPAEGMVVVHGDACLPNFLATGEQISGYLDVGDLRIDRPEVDLSAAIWSLQHNLGSGWGAPFLRAYGWPDEDEATVERLRLSYKGE